MKKLILIAGLAGIIVTGAFAQGTGTTSVTQTIKVKVQTYINITPLSGGTYCFNVTDGGYSSYYSSSTGPQSFTATANTTYGLTTSVSIATYTVWTKLDSGAFGLNQGLSGQTATNNLGQGHTLDLQLQGTSAGLSPDVSGTPGTVTLTITAS